MADETDIEGSDLAALIANELRSARRFADSELSDKRAENIEYYQGVMRDVPAPPNRSSVVSRDVTDTISWMLPGIIRVFTASDNMVIYEPVTEKDREFAQQATDYVNYLFFKDNEGYRTLYNATHDSLLGGNGIVYHYWDPTPETEISHHTRLTPPQIALLLEDEGVEILAQRQNDEPDTLSVPDPSGQMIEVQVPTFDVKVSRTKSRGKLCVHTCKPENFYLDSEAVTIAEARFCAYLHDHKTRSDLVQMGFDKDVVDNLSRYNRVSDQETLAREWNKVDIDTNLLKSQDLIDLYEVYVKADIDGDGIAELLQVWYAGNSGSGEILDWSEWEDDLPFSDIPCYPVPHRWDADSVADRTKDIQRVKTVLLRQSLDNIYASQLPMMEAEAGSVLNPDILVAPKFGGIIWRKQGTLATAPIKPFAIPFVADKTFTAMEYMDTIRATRTGVSRTTMALDPEALQNQTATANQNQRDAGYSQIELVARNMAELGWTNVFRAMLRLVVKHQDRPRVIRLRDEFVEMDPRVWNAEMDVIINVGLGTGSRDRDMLMLNQVKQDQFILATQFADRGAVDKAIDMIPRILLTMKKSAESAGLKNPDAFYPEFGPEDVEKLKQLAAQPQPNPKLEEIKAQGEVQANLKQVDAQVDMHAAELKAQGEVVKNQAELEADLATKAADRENALLIEDKRGQIELEKQAREHAFRQWEIQEQNAMERERMANSVQIAAMKPDPKPAAAN